MEDREIIELYFRRSEAAIRETDLKYGGQVRAAANGILRNTADAEECASDTWLRAWNAIPPQRPRVLGAWLLRIVRNLSLDRLRRAKALKRGVVTLALDELGEVAAVVSDDAEGREIMAVVNRFLAGQSRENRALFLRRYWYLDSVVEAARFVGRSEGAAKMALARMRRGLRKALEKEEIVI